MKNNFLEVCPGISTFPSPGANLRKILYMGRSTAAFITFSSLKMSEGTLPLIYCLAAATKVSWMQAALSINFFLVSGVHQLWTSPAASTVHPRLSMAENMPRRMGLSKKGTDVECKRREMALTNATVVGDNLTVFSTGSYAKPDINELPVGVKGSQKYSRFLANQYWLRMRRIRL